MSEETAIKLKEAQEALSVLDEELNDQKNAFLAAVAAHVPRRVTEFAKRTAHSEPEVTKALGADGVKAMREEIEGLADQLSKDIAAAAPCIEWPRPTPYAAIRFNDLRSSLFTYMRPKMDEFAQVFKRNGFNVRDGNRQNSQTLVMPQWFYSEDDLKVEAEALVAGLSGFERAKLVEQKAKEADDASTVADLWGE